MGLEKGRFGAGFLHSKYSRKRGTQNGEGAEAAGRRGVALARCRSTYERMEAGRGMCSIL